MILYVLAARRKMPVVGMEDPEEIWEVYVCS